MAENPAPEQQSEDLVDRLLDELERARAEWRAQLADSEFEAHRRAVEETL